MGNVVVWDIEPVDIDLYFQKDGFAERLKAMGLLEQFMADVCSNMRDEIESQDLMGDAIATVACRMGLADMEV